MSRTEQTWLTVPEAMRAAERNRNYFEQPLVSFGGRCRLEVWREEGHADRADGRTWLIHRGMVDQVRRKAADSD